MTKTMITINVKKGDACPFCRDDCNTDCPLCSGSGFAMSDARVEKSQNDFFAQRIGTDTRHLGGLIKAGLGMLFPEEEEDEKPKKPKKGG